MKKYIVFTISGAFAICNALAQKDTILKLQEVEVTSGSTKSILYQPASVAKLNEVELKRGTGLFLDDAINGNVPGVFMERRTVSAGQQFNIRGYGNGARGTNGVNSNFDGQGSKIYLNNIPITDAEGITLMDDIDFGSIGNVEIVKGPAGALYGLAIAGAVNLKTITADKGKVSIGQDVMMGSYGLQRYTTHLKIGGDRSSFLVNYGKQKYDGFMVHTVSHKDFVNIVGEFTPNEKQKITTYVGYSNSYDERNGELDSAQYATFDYSGNPNYIKNNAHSEIISFRTGVGHTYAFNKHLSNTTSVFGCGQSQNVSSAGGWTDKAPINYGIRSTFDMKFALNEKVSLNGVAGIEAQEQYAQVIGYAMIANPDPTQPYNIIGALRSNINYRTTTSSVFTEWTLGLPKDLSITAGIGSSSMLISLHDRLYVSTNTKSYFYSKGYGNMFSPHVALNKVFNKNISAYASYSTGYKAPVSSYIFIPTTNQLNTELKPEMGTQFEIGTKGSLMNDKLTYQVALFNAIFSNKMTTVAVPNATNTATSYTYVTNGGNQNNKGLEVLLKYTVYESTTGFFTAIKPFANFCYSNFKYEDFKFQKLNSAKTDIVEVDYSGKAVAGVPPVTANAGIDIITKAGIYANVNYSYRDAMPYTSDGISKTTAFSIVNAKLGIHKSFLKHFDIDAYVGANNITGTQYYYMVFLNQLPDAYLPAPNEINYFGGVNLKYTF